MNESIRPCTAIIYAYGAESADAGGRAQQVQRCQAYAARHLLDVCQVVSEEKWAGTTLTRPAFGPLFAALTSQPVPPAYLLVTNIDRLGRSHDPDAGGYIEFRLRKAGIQLIDVDRVDLPAHPGWEAWTQYHNTTRKRHNSNSGIAAFMAYGKIQQDTRRLTVGRST